MKSVGTQYWNTLNYGTNESGFSGLPAGNRQPEGTFINVGIGGFWWGATESDDTYGSGCKVDAFSSDAYSNVSPKVIGCSVRCLKD
jgi:uncharacterized protein (TIGR02145 family)